MTRYIDADAVISGVKNRCIGQNDVVKVEHSIISMLYMMPTIDAEPVRHGKWIDETFEPWGLVHHPFKCNLCGEHAEFASPYCPECGSRMDKE